MRKLTSLVIATAIAMLGMMSMPVQADLYCSWTGNNGRVLWYSVPPGLSPKQVRFELVGGINMASSAAKKVYVLPFKMSNDVAETMTDYGKTVNNESLEIIRSSWLTGKMISMSTTNCNAPVMVPIVTQVTAGTFAP